MWFVNFVLLAAVLVTSLVLGLSTYLERSASTVRLIEVVPLPMPKPKLAVQRRPQAAEERELVVVPKAKDGPHNKEASHKKSRRVGTW
jgi:hypothetical protein